MRALFGIPMEGLALGLSLALGLVLALVAVLALRNRVFLRLGLRNAARRPGRALLIVTGLMLGTTIFASALVTGDTMNRTVRSAVIETLGTTDEVVTAPGADLAPSSALEQAARLPYLDAAQVPAAERALRRTGLVDGVTPAVVEPVAVQDLTTRRTEARVSLFGADPAAMGGMDEIRDRSGARRSLADLEAGQVYLDRDGAAALGARAGDRLRVLAGVREARLRVAAIVDYDGAGSDDAAVLLPLRRAQALVGHEGEVGRLLVSNRGDATGGASHTADVLAAAGPAIAAQGLDLQDVKRDGLELADDQADVFVSVFTTFGSFSIAAGILLIFLIFVMLSAERRTELGIARAIGTRREHLVQMFTFEGLAYDLGAAALGAALGVAVAFGMVAVLSDAFSNEGLEIQHAVTLRSLLVAYALGVLLTFAIVAVSAWRVSVLNIVAAVRGLPDTAAPRGGRRRVGLGAAGFAAGVALAAAGVASEQATPFSLGISIAVISAVLLARAAGASARAAYSAAGLLLLVWWLLPFDTINAIAGRELKMDFTAWIVSGLMVVAGATWLIVYNADVLLGVAMRGLGRIRALAPVLKMAMAFPLRTRFRTGVTLAMFTLVVFTIVVGATTSGAFLRAVDDPESFGGGFDVRAETAPQSPLGEPTTAIRGAGLDPADFRVVGSESVVPARVRQAGARGRRGVPRPGLRPAVPPGHDVPARRHRDRLRLLAGGLGRDAPLARSRRGRPARRTASRQLGLRHAARLPPDRLLRRGRGVRAGAGRGPRSRLGSFAHAHRHRRARRHDAARPRRRVDLAADGGERVRRDARHPDHPPRRARARRGPGPRRGGARARARRQRPGGEVDPGGPPRGRRRVVHAQLAPARLHGAGARGRRRRARRDQRPLGRRAASADRRAARDRLPPRHGPAQLPARVVVHRADRDRGRDGARPDHRVQRHPGRRRSAVLAGRAALRRAVDAPRHRVLRRLCGGAADDARARRPRLARPARPGPPLRVIGMTPDWEERLFDGRPTPLRLYRAIRQRLETFGPLTVRGTDTQVSFRARRAFAWVWLPQRWAEGRPADSVTLTFSLDAPLDDRRIVQVVEPRPGHWTHHVVIQDESDLDGAVDGWLRQAYRLAGGDAR